MITRPLNDAIAKEMMSCALHLAKKCNYADDLASLRMAAIAVRISPHTKNTSEFVRWAMDHGQYVVFGRTDPNVDDILDRELTHFLDSTPAEEVYQRIIYPRA